MPGVVPIPAGAIEEYTAAGGLDQLFTLEHPATAVTKLIATQEIVFNVTKSASAIDNVTPKPRVGNFPLRKWFVDFALTNEDQLPATFIATVLTTSGTSYTQTFTRTTLPIAMPAGVAQVVRIESMLGALEWEYRIGEDVHVYAQGVEHPLVDEEDPIPDSPLPTGTVYSFVGNNRRRLALGDDFVIDAEGRIKIFINLVAGSIVHIDYDFNSRSSMTGWD